MRDVALGIYGYGRKRRVAPLIVAFVVAIHSSAAASAEVAYRVGAGDELNIIMPMTGGLGDVGQLASNSAGIEFVGDRVYWRRQVVVAPDGLLTIPFLPSIKAAGLTLKEIEETINAKLRSDKRVASASVVLLRPSSAGFYVWGEVKNPGRFILDRPMTLMDAIGSAGGLTDHARVTRIRLLRPGQPAITLNCSQKFLLKNGFPDVHIQAADTIMVPKKLVSPDSPGLFLLLSALTAATGVFIASKQ